MRIRPFLFGVLAAQLVAPLGARAFTFQFQATVTSVGIAQEDLSVGDTVSGTIVFDPSLATVTTNTATDLELEIAPPLAGNEVQLTAGGNVLTEVTSFSLTLLVRDASTGPDLFIIQGQVTSEIFSGQNIVFEIELRDFEGQGITGVAVPSTLDLSDFSDDFAEINFLAGREAISANLTSLTYVPEPGVALLGLTGLSALAARGRTQP